MRTVTLLTLYLVVFMAARGQNFEYQGLNYSITNATTNECTLTGPVDPNISILDVPAYAIYYRTAVGGQTEQVQCPVIAIGYDAFKNKDKLVKVTMSDNVRILSEGAFENCDMLEEIRLSDNIESIGNSALRGLPELTKIILPRELKTLGYSALSNNTVLREIVFNDKLETVDRYTFTQNKALKEITLPASLKQIGERSFYGCDALRKVTFLGPVEKINYWVFDGCSKLAEVHAPDLKTWMGMGFHNETSNPLYYAKDLYLGGEKVTDLTIPGTYSTVQNYAFISGSVETVRLEDGITNLGYNSFQGCENLRSIDLGNTIETIGSASFRDCTALETLTIPKSVKTAGASMLEQCRNLKSITWEGYIDNIGGLGYMASLEEVVIKDLSAWCRQNFPKSYNPVQYAGTVTLNGERITDLVIPENVAQVGSAIFRGATELKSVVIPNNVKSIGTYAFFGCGHIEKISLGNSLKSVDPYLAFYGCSAVRQLRIEDGTEPLVLQQFAGSEMTALSVLYLGREVTVPNFPTKNLRVIEVGKDVTDMGSIGNTKYTNLKYIQTYAAEPPVTEEFSADQYKNVIVLVPEGSLEKYKNAAVWKEFENIMEHAPVDFTGATVSFEKESYDLGNKQTIEIPVTITPDFLTTDDIVISKSNYSMNATFGDNGMLNVSGGAGTITLTIPYSGCSATVNVNLLPTPTKISILPEEITVKVGQSIDLDVAVEPENAYPSQYEWYGQAWQPYVSIEGNTLTGIAKGTTTILVKISDPGYYVSGSRKVTVIEDPTGVESIVCDGTEAGAIYTLQGVPVSGNKSELAPGVYIIMYGNRAEKLIVK